MALGNLGLFFVRHPRFLGGNRTELTPGGCTGWEVCQDSAVILRMTPDSEPERQNKTVYTGADSPTNTFKIKFSITAKETKKTLS